MTKHTDEPKERYCQHCLTTTTCTTMEEHTEFDSEHYDCSEERLKKDEEEEDFYAAELLKDTGFTDQQSVAIVALIRNRQRR